MRPNRTTLIAAGLAIVLSGVGGVAAEIDYKADAPSRQNSPQSSAPTIQVYSRETVVDVVVTDAKGEPVRGLKQSDFTVKEDGKPQTVRSLKESGPGSTVVQRVLPKLPPGVYSNVEATPVSGPVYVILMDALNTSGGDEGTMRRETIEYLKSMPADTQIAVFVLSPNKGLRMLQGFTSDGAALTASVERLDLESFRHHPLPSPRMTVEAMNHIAAYVAGIKGRKNLLWFTGYMPIAIVRDGGYRDGIPPALVSFREVSKLYETLTAEQVAIYPVSAGFHHDGGGYLPQVPGIHTEPVSLADNPPGTAPNQLFLPDEVAEGTGGVVFGGDSLHALIAQAIENGRSFYTLTYVPPTFANDTRYHTIDIKVDRPGVHVVYRKGFNAEDVEHSPPPAGPRQMQAAMGGGAPPATQLLFDVRVQPSTEPVKSTGPPVMGVLDAKLKKAPLTRYGFLYLLPMSQIGFVDGPGETHRGSLEFDVAAYDSDGKLATMLSQTMKLPLTKEEYEQFVKTPFQFFQQLDLPPGQFSLRIGILDGVSNKVGTIDVPLTVPKPAALASSGKGH